MQANEARSAVERWRQGVRDRHQQLVPYVRARMIAELEEAIATRSLDGMSSAVSATYQTGSIEVQACSDVMAHFEDKGMKTSRPAFRESNSWYIEVSWGG